MPTVKMPNGDLVRFPDDMPKEKITAFIQEKFPDAFRASPAPDPAMQETQGLIDAGKNALRYINPIQGLASMAGERIGQAIVGEERDTRTPALPMRLGADRAVPQEIVDAQIAAGRQEAFNQLPLYQKPVVALNDTVRNLAQGQTFGFADKAAAAANAARSDATYDEQLKIERERTRAAQDRAGTAATGAELTGALMTGKGLADLGLTSVGRFARPGAINAAARVVAPTLEGAAYGTVDALGNDKDVKTGALIGAAAGLGGKFVGDVIDAGAKKLSTQAEIPALAALREKQKEAYKVVEDAGVILKPNVVSDIKTTVQSELTKMSYRPKLMPRIKNALDEIDNEIGNNITLNGLESLRRVFRIAGQSDTPAEREAASRMIAAIDDRIAKINAKDMLTGDLKAFKALRDARDLTVKVKKTEQLQKAVNTAKNRASSTYSGGNEENAIRQNIRRLMEKNDGRGWTADEKAVMQEIVSGSIGQNTLRKIGKLSPNGNGLNLMLSLLGASVAPQTLAVPAAGLVAKASADRGVRQAVERLNVLVRSGGSKQALDALNQTVRGLSSEQRAALARLINFGAIVPSGRDN